MLPSADAAMVAFAEVTSFVRFYARSAATPGADDALPKLLHELKEGKEPDAALHAASGADLQGWDAKWRPTSPPARASPPGPLRPRGRERGRQNKLRDLRDRSRLAELLMGREARQRGRDRSSTASSWPAPRSPPEAWDRAMGDPSVRWLRARALEAAGRRKEGERLVDDPKQVLSSYGPWWAIRGADGRGCEGDEPTATASFIEAVVRGPLRCPRRPASRSIPGPTPSPLERGGDGRPRVTPSSLGQDSGDLDVPKAAEMTSD